MESRRSIVTLEMRLGTCKRQITKAMISDE